MDVDKLDLKNNQLYHMTKNLYLEKSVRHNLNIDESLPLNENLIEDEFKNIIK